MDFRMDLPNMNIQIVNISAHFNEAIGGWKYPKHHHDAFEFLYVLHGSAILTVNETSNPIDSGDGILLRPNELHDFRVPLHRDCHYFTFHFNVDDMQLRHLLCICIDGLIPNTLPSTRTFRNRIESIRSLSGLTGNIYNTNRPLHLVLDKRLRIQAEVYGLLVELTEVMTTKRQDGLIRKDITFRKAEIADAIMQFMNERLSSAIQIQEVAKHFNVSLSYCSQIFTNVYGISPRAYLSRRKLLEAKRYLMESKLTVEQIAELLGFASSAHFSRQFKRWTQMSPIQFRSKSFS